MYFDPMQRRGPMPLQGPRVSYEGNPYGGDAGGGPGMFQFPHQMQMGGGLPMQPMQPRLPMQTGGPGQMQHTNYSPPLVSQWPSQVGGPGQMFGQSHFGTMRTGGVMPPMQFNPQQMGGLARMFFGGAMR